MRKVIFGVLITIILVGLVVVVDHSMRVNREHDGLPTDTAKEKFLPHDGVVTNFSTRKDVALSSFNGKVVLINFWASWCEACMAEMPSIQKLYEKLHGEGLEVVAISVDENADKVVPQIVKALRLTFPVYLDKDNELARAFDVVAIPFSVVADRKGKIVDAEAGERDWSSDAIVGSIRRLLKPI